MPSSRVVRISGVEASPEAGAPAGSLPIAPLSATSGGVAANGCSANRDRKRAASVDDCGDLVAPPGSAVLAPYPGRHVAGGPAPAGGPVIAAADHAPIPSKSVGSKRRGPPKKRICSDLATAAATAAPAVEAAAEGLAEVIRSGERRALLGGSATANPMNESLGAANYLSQVHGYQQRNDIQPSANFLDSLDHTLMRNTIADLSLPVSSSVGALAAPYLSSLEALPPHLLLLCQQQLYGYSALHNQGILRAMSTAAVLGEIEAHELALAQAQAQAHQAMASTPALQPHHTQRHQVAARQVEGVDIDYDLRKEAPVTIKNQDELQVADARPIAGASSAGQFGKFFTTINSCRDATSLQHDTKSKKNKNTSSKGPTKILKKKAGTSDGIDVDPAPEHASGDKRPRVAATQSIFPQTNNSSILLSHSDDENLLSPYLCIIRKQIEVFASTPEDIKAKLSVGGNKIPPIAGQIGLRCIHCKHVPFRDRAKSSESYPNLLKNIHQSVRNYQRHHWPNCKEIPVQVRKEVEASLGSKLSKSKGNAGQWWIRSCRDRGLFDTEEVKFLDERKRTGIFLVGASDQPTCKSETSIQIQNMKDEKKGSKTNRRSKSAASNPKTKATSLPNRSGLDVLLAATGVADRGDAADAMSVSAALPVAEIPPMQPSSDKNDRFANAPSISSPAAGAIATLQHECIHPLLPGTHAFAPDSQNHSKVWFTQNMVEMLGGESNREIIDLEGTNIVVRELSRLRQELLPIYFGVTFTLTSFEILLTSLGFHVSFFSDNEKVFTLTEGSADIVKILTGGKASDES